MSTVRFDQVSKQFSLHARSSGSFQEVFLSALHSRRRSPPGPTRQSRQGKFWALRDVSFAVEPGEMVGIIGANGAGKSTILKLISRIIEPTSGHIELDGRVGALLELGTGFHPDLTGRENVYMNGSILGFSRQKVKSIFDEIVEFAEMERFIDVPVKHYSSGMYMRLGFSIAIHVEPDVLLVDEVLAVGDHAFQRRCLDRIHEMRRRGATIVLVTHGLETVRQMCNRAIWLEDGRVAEQGPVQPVLEQYLASVEQADGQAIQKAEVSRLEGTTAQPSGETHGADKAEAAWRWGSREAEFTRIQLLDGQGRECRLFSTGDTLVARMHFVAHQRIEHPLFGVALHHASGFHLSGPNTGFAGYPIDGIEGEGVLDFTIPSLPLLAGTYLLSTALYDALGQHAYDCHHMAYTFRVAPNPEVAERYGALLIPSQWYLHSSEGLPSKADGLRLQEVPAAEDLRAEGVPTAEGGDAAL